MSENNIQSNIPEMEALISARPSLFMRSGAFLILGVMVIIIALAWLIQAPEVITNDCTLYAGRPAALCCFGNNGILDTVLIHEGETANKGAIMATLTGAISYADYISFHSLIHTLSENRNNLRVIEEAVKNSQTLFNAGEPGENLNNLSHCLCEYFNYYNNNSIFEQLDLITSENINLKKAIEIQQRSLAKDKEEMLLSMQQFHTDSLLWRDGIISKAVYEKALLNIIRLQRNNNEKLEQANEYAYRRKALSYRKEILTKEYHLDISRLEISVFSALDHFINNFRKWEEQNIIRSPEQGMVSLSKQWHKGQSVNKGDIFGSVFKSRSDSIYALIPVSGTGTGKIMVNQKVVFSINQYPAEEFGYLCGTVTSKSNIPINGTYQIIVNLKKPLTTNWSFPIPQGEYSAKAEIITKKSNLLLRIFRIAQSKTQKPG